MPFDLVADVTCFLRVRGELEGVAHDAVAADAGKDRLLHRHFHRRSRKEPAADLGILALVVLAHDVEIDLAGLAVLERRVDAGKQPHRPQIDVLLEVAADRDQQAPQRDMIGHAGISDGAEEDAVHALDLVEPVLRHHRAALGEALAAPIVVLPFEREAVAARRGLEHAHAFRHDFLADPVTGDDGDFVSLGHDIVSLALRRAR